MSTSDRAHPADGQRHDQLPAPLLRGLTQRRISRRGALGLGGMSALAMGLAACGIPGKAVSAGGGGAASVQEFWSKQKKHGTVRWANWPLYIDVSSTNKSDHPTIDHFTKQTGIKVQYFEVIQSDADFFAKIRPALQAGHDCGYDFGIVQNDQFFLNYVDLGLLRELDQSRMTNFYKSAGRTFLARSYDPGNRWSIPWQAGFTGIGYAPKYTGREITSWQDLADPKFKGKVGMFGNTVDLPNAALLAIGVEPEKSTPSDWRKAAAWIDKIKPNVRQFYGQDYISALTKGDVWISMAYSGDIYQSNLSGAQLKFVLPKEKGTLWIDNMVLYHTARNPVDAMELMDFYYEPRQAADLTEYVNYITPVPAGKSFILDDAKHAKDAKDASYLKDLTTSFAVFPTPADYAKSALGRIPTPKELTLWNQIFEPTFQS